jgi:hypothetical protein
MMGLPIGFLIGISIGLLSTSIPAYHYSRMKRLSTKKFKKYKFLIYPEITIVLPVKDESLLISRKLNEIMNMDYPLSSLNILILDSSSDKKTSDLAYNFFKNHKNKISFQIIKINISGKSYAVNRALELVNTKFFIMLDVEPSISKNSFKLLMNWFMDPKIGAVCGNLATISQTSNSHYRKRFNIIRTGESYLDSTPIFEGSLCAFRMASIGDRKIINYINADDSQLAIIVRNNGFKAIMDPNLKFVEIDNNSFLSNIIRQTRRAQGLIRTLLHYVKLEINNPNYRKIYFNNLYFYVIYPWLILMSIVLILISFSINFNQFNEYSYLYVPFVLSILILIKPISNFLIGISVLLSSQILLIFGKKLNSWDTDQKMRMNIKLNEIKD